MKISNLAWILCATRSAITPYAKQNGGPFSFIIDLIYALPDDQVNGFLSLPVANTVLSLNKLIG